MGLSQPFREWMMLRQVIPQGWERFLKRFVHILGKPDEVTDAERGESLALIPHGGVAVGLILLVAGIQFYYMSQYIYGLRSISHLGAVLILAVLRMIR